MGKKTIKKVELKKKPAVKVPESNITRMQDAQKEALAASRKLLPKKSK